MRRILCRAAGHTIPGKDVHMRRRLRVIYGWGMPVVDVDWSPINWSDGWSRPHCMCGSHYVTRPEYVQRRIKAASDKFLDVG